MPGVATGVWPWYKHGQYSAIELRQATSPVHNTGLEIRMNFANVLGLAFIALAALTAPQTVQAQHACIANYSTDGRVVRSAQEDEVLGNLSDTLADILRTQIEDALNGTAWRAPFAQARYDDMLFTLSFLDLELGPTFTPQMQAAVVAQFMSPVVLHETMEPIKELLLGDPPRFEALLERHVGAYMYWQQFSLCSVNSPYSFFQGIFERVAIEASASSANDDYRFIRERLSAVPKRNLGGQDLIIRQSYLPDQTRPLIRFALPPCGTDNEVRNIVFEYDLDGEVWVGIEPPLPVRTWYQRGFSDWDEVDMDMDRRGFQPTNPKQYAEAQSELIARFEELQVLIGMPIEFPRNLDLDCP